MVKVWPCILLDKCLKRVYIKMQYILHRVYPPDNILFRQTIIVIGIERMLVDGMPQK